MKKYKIKLRFSCNHFCRNNYELWCKFFKEIENFNESSLISTSLIEIEISDRQIIVKYKYNSPVKELSKIIKKYRDLKLNENNNKKKIS